MIRTYILPCHLPKADADALNQASGAVYTRTLVAHYRIYRKKGRWLSRFAGQKLNDYFTRDDAPLLHAFSKDGAQQGFYRACTATREARKAGVDAKYPRRRKRYRTTTWYNNGIRVRDTTILLSRAKGLPPIRIPVPDWFTPTSMRLLEVRLVWDRCGKRYQWHLVVETGKQPKAAPGKATVAIDLGEVHPAVCADGATALVVSARELRSKRQYTAKRLSYLQKRQSRLKKHSRRWWRFQRVKNRFRAKQQRRIRDIEHKVSRTVVSYAVERQAMTLAIGDVRDVADKPKIGTHINQKISTWRHGRLRQFLTYKAEAEGMAVQFVDEHHTSQTCPACGARHKPRGRIYRCPACRFQAHRDVVGAVNILSRQLYGDVGRLRPPDAPMYRYPFLTGKRSCRDTGQPPSAVAYGKP